MITNIKDKSIEFLTLNSTHMAFLGGRRRPDLIDEAGGVSGNSSSLTLEENDEALSYCELSPKAISLENNDTTEGNSKTIDISIELDTLNSTSTSFLSETRRADAQTEVTYHTPDLAKLSPLIDNISSHHVRIESLATTITLCNSAATKYIPGHINAQGFLCSAAGATALVTNGKVSAWIKAEFGSNILKAANLGAIGFIEALNYFLPVTTNKFTQQNLLKGLTLGYLAKDALTSIIGSNELTQPGLHAASIDAITGFASLGFANYLSGGLSSHLNPNSAQLLYRAFDIPLNYMVTYAANTLNSASFALVTLASLALRGQTHDFMTNKNPFVNLGIFAGLAITPSFLSWANTNWLSSTKSLESNSLPQIREEDSSTIYDQEQSSDAGSVDPTPQPKPSDEISYEELCEVTLTGDIGELI